MSHLLMWMVMTMVSVCGNEARFMYSTENVMGIWDHLVLVMGPSIVVSLLPLVIEVGIGASGDGEDCAMGREVVALLWRLADL
jgi:hypothetical protein